MADPRPQLIFLSGPQRGRLAVLMGADVVAGRSPSADIHLTEEHVSRRQIRFWITPDGWVMENLSPSGTRVNENRYKSGKLILLGTGDVLGVGKHTELLFVAPGDDPDEALRGYREAHPQYLHAARELPPGPEEPRTEAPPLPVVEPVGGPPTVTLEGERRKRKLKRYAIAFAVYLAFIISFVILVKLHRGGREDAPEGAVGRLKQEDIKKILTEIPVKGHPSADPEKALRDALRAYPNRKFTPGGLYRCVKSFEEYRAYKTFENYEDGKKYRQALDELVDQVTKTYDKAVLYEHGKQWDRARETWEQLYTMVPELDTDSAVYKKLVSNIKEHMAYSSGKDKSRR